MVARDDGIGEVYKNINCREKQFWKSGARLNDLVDLNGD